MAKRNSRAVVAAVLLAVGLAACGPDPVGKFHTPPDACHSAAPGTLAAVLEDGVLYCARPNDMHRMLAGDVQPEDVAEAIFERDAKGKWYRVDS